MFGKKERIEIKINEEMKELLKEEAHYSRKTMTDIIEELLIIKYCGYEWETGEMQVNEMNVFVSNLDLKLIRFLKERLEYFEKRNEQKNKKDK